VTPDMVEGLPLARRADRAWHASSSSTYFYSQIPGHMKHYAFLFVGLNGYAPLVPWIWTSVVLAAVSLGLLVARRTRENEKTLGAACAMVFLSLWIDKGLGLIVGGFVPSPMGAITRYVPTLPEVSITLAIWAVGFLLITVLYKIALAVREELATI